MSQIFRLLVAMLILCFGAAALAADVQLTALQLPEGKSLDVSFTPTKRAPSEATLKAELRYNKGQAQIDLKFEKMEPAILFHGDISAFVLWAVTPDGVTENLGEMIVNKPNCSASQKFSSGLKIFALMVTAEPLAVVARPSELVLFTSDALTPKEARNTPFTFGQFQSGVKFALDSIAGVQYKDPTPVAIKQAQKAMEFAERYKAEEVNPAAMREAKQAYTQALNASRSSSNAKVVTDYGRRTVELASQAIRDAIRAMEAKAAAEAEAKRQAEKAALEKRAATAETESQRNARLLREVEEQRAALATESKQLTQDRDRFAAERDLIASERDKVKAERDIVAVERDKVKAERDQVATERDKVKAERDQVATERDKVALERELIKKERDELSNTLKSALASVAETNETARGVIVSLPGILFDVNKATLKPSAQLTVAKLAGIMVVFQKMNLSIEGHTDSTGTDEINQKLSYERARTVYDFLRMQGLTESRMKYQGFGSANPTASNDTETGRAKNRRVEVVITQAPK